MIRPQNRGSSVGILYKLNLIQIRFVEAVAIELTYQTNMVTQTFVAVSLYKRPNKPLYTSNPNILLDSTTEESNYSPILILLLMYIQPRDIRMEYLTRSESAYNHFKQDIRLSQIEKNSIDINMSEVRKS